MRKLPHHIENPIDSLLVDIADIIDPYFKEVGMTPNVITTFGLISALISIHQFCSKHYKSSAIFFFLSYFLDCMDGNFARKYDMITDFGDYYDHVVDIFKSIIIYSLLFYNLYNNNRTLIIMLLILLFVTSLINFGCQEKYVEKYNEKILSHTLKPLKLLCYVPSDNLENILNITKYGSSGTLALVTTIIIYNLDSLTL